MSGLLGKLFTTLLILTTCCCCVTLGYAQSDAVIVGKIDSPSSRVIRFEYKRNHFSLEEGSFEATLDTNNVFSVRVKLKEPRAIYCTYLENAVKLYVAPGDTLKMRFSSGEMLETLSFDGNTALHNQYLVKSQQKFPDWLNENPLVNARIDKGSRDYLAHIDSIFNEKRHYFDSYPSDLKANFTNDFLEFATNDINYWRAYELMLYVKNYGLNNNDPKRLIDDNYFNFTLETDNIYFKALNNEYYLQYLELYLGYLSEKNGTGHKEPLEIIEEKSRSIKIVKPKNRNIRVIEEPFLPRDVVSWLGPNEEAVYQNLLTSDKFNYVGEDSTFADIFLKIKTSDGKTGWIPQSVVIMSEKTIVERTVRNRFCIQPDEPLCGFDKYLTGKVLYFTVAKDILYGLVYDKLDVLELRIKKFTEKNLDHKEYNEILRDAQDLTIKEREKGLFRLNIPASCEIDEYWKDRVYYARNLINLKKGNSTKVVADDVVVDYTPPVYKEKEAKTFKSNERKTVLTSPPVVTNESKQAELKTEVTTPPIANETKLDEPNTEQTTPPIVLKEPKPTERNTEPTSPPVGNESKPTEPKTIPLTTNPVNEQPVTSSDDKNKIEIQPQVRSESKTRDNTPPPNNFSIGDEKGILKFNTAQGFIPLGDYDPMGKTIIFKGMVINESITPFEFTDINNNPIRQQDLIGKIVVLNFWATWCSPCKPTIEYTQRLANKYNDKDVVFLYVSADSDVATWKEYLKEHPIKGIQGLDDNRLLRINLRIQGVPNYFIVDKKGRIAYNSIIESKMNAEEMIDFLLKSP